MKNAALIVRVSDERQDTSPANQRTQLNSYIDLITAKAEAEEKPEDRVRVYREYQLIGVSGKDSFDSTEFEKLRSDILRGDIDVVMATGLDRFGRNVAKFLEFFEFLRELNIDLVVTQYQIDTTTPIGQLIITILMALAEMQRLQYSEKQIGTQHTRFKRGRRTGGSVPLGFDEHPTEKGLYVINEEEAEIVRLAFDLYLKLKNLAAVTRELNKRGFRTKRVKTRKGKIKGGKPFAADSVKYILENCIYIGTLEEHKANKGKPNSEVPENQRYSKKKPDNPDEWPHIVTEEVFYLVRDLLSKHARLNKKGSRKTYPYVLSGLVYCDLCDGEMPADKGQKKYYYYACPNPECVGRKLIPENFTRLKRNSIDASVLEKAIMMLVRDVVLKSPGDIKEITKSANAYLGKRSSMVSREIRSLESRCDSLNAEKRGILVVLCEMESEKGLPDRLKKDLQEIDREMTDLEKQIEQKRSELVVAEQEKVSEAAIRGALELFVQTYHEVPDQQQKELLRLFFGQIRVGVEKIKAHLLLDSILYLARKRPNPREFDWTRGWYARQDSNPEPPGP